MNRSADWWFRRNVAAAVASLVAAFLFLVAAPYDPSPEWRELFRFFFWAAAVSAVVNAVMAFLWGRDADAE